MVTCAVTTSFLGCLVTTCLYFRYTLCLNIGLLPRLLLFVPFLVAGCVPLLVSYRLENVFGSFYPFYRYGLYFIFIGCIILFTVTLIADALFWLLSFTPLLPKFSFCCRWLNWGNLALSLLFAAGALYAGVKVPVVKNVHIPSERLDREYTVVVLSDLHIHRVINPLKIERIVSLANARNPDVVLLAGDIIDDDVRRVSKITALLKGLKASKGIYFVTGNHEFYAGYDETVRELANLGFMFLENDGAAVGEDLYLAGVPDTFAGAAYGKTPDLNRAFAKAGKGAFRLLVSHTPSDFAGRDFDLEVSGHTHGGQIPFLEEAFNFNGVPSRYESGLLLEHRSWLLISRGVGTTGLPARLFCQPEIHFSNGAGQWGPQMRFLAPSEITVLKLTPEKQEK